MIDESTSMTRRFLSLVLPLLALAACSRQAPASGDGAEREIAGLERQAADLPPVPAALEASGASAGPDEAARAEDASGALVTPRFRAAAIVARASLDDLSRATASDEAFDAALAAARGSVTSARGVVQSSHDRSAAIVLTALLAKQKELTFLNMLLQRNSTLARDPQLESEVQACSNELRSWLDGSAADAAQLLKGDCLLAARAALAVISQ
jgi:hypothetical protein